MKALETTTNISFRNILLLTDFSEASEKAKSYAVGLARHFKANLFPAHACDPAIFAGDAGADVVNRMLEGKRKTLADLIQEKAVTAFPLVTRGSLESTLPRWLEENGIDLVVAGTHGRRGLQRFLLGSTAEFVFRNATCAVLTVGPHVASMTLADFKPRDILFPTDLGVDSEPGAAYALSFARETHARLNLMHVIPSEEARQQGSTRRIMAAIAKLKQLVPPDAELWCEPQYIVEIGEPAEKILSHAEFECPDMIVLGLPHNKEFNSFHTGVAYKLVSGASCPVLTIRNMAMES